MTFGDRLRELRKEHDMTQKQLADILGISDRAIGYYEAGERFPPEDILVKIADIFQTTIDYLLGRSNIRDRAIVEAAYDPDLPPDWIREVEFIRRAGTKLSPEERRAFIELAKVFVKRVEAEERERLRREDKRGNQ